MNTPQATRNLVNAKNQYYRQIRDSRLTPEERKLAKTKYLAINKLMASRNNPSYLSKKAKTMIESASFSDLYKGLLAKYPNYVSINGRFSTVLPRLNSSANDIAIVNLAKTLVRTNIALVKLVLPSYARMTDDAILAQSLSIVSNFMSKAGSIAVKEVVEPLYEQAVIDKLD